MCSRWKIENLNAFYNGFFIKLHGLKETIIIQDRKQAQAHQAHTRNPNSIHWNYKMSAMFFLYKMTLKQQIATIQDTGTAGISATACNASSGHGSSEDNACHKCSIAEKTLWLLAYVRSRTSTDTNHAFFFFLNHWTTRIPPKKAIRINQDHSILKVWVCKFLAQQMKMACPGTLPCSTNRAKSTRNLCRTKPDFQASCQNIETAST